MYFQELLRLRLALIQAEARLPKNSYYIAYHYIVYKYIIDIE